MFLVVNFEVIKTGVLWFLPENNHRKLVLFFGLNIIGNQYNWNYHVSPMKSGISYQTILLGFSQNRPPQNILVFCINVSRNHYSLITMFFWPIKYGVSLPNQQHVFVGVIQAGKKLQKIFSETPFKRFMTFFKEIFCKLFEKYWKCWLSFFRNIYENLDLF